MMQRSPVSLTSTRRLIQPGAPFGSLRGWDPIQRALFLIVKEKVLPWPLISLKYFPSLEKR